MYPYPGINPADLVEDSTSQKMHDEALEQMVKKVIHDEFEVVPAWRQKSKDMTFVITCPSGQKCLAKRLNTIDLIEADLLDEIDFFQQKLFSAVDAQGTPTTVSSSTFSELLKDPTKRKRLFALLDKLMSVSVVKPKIHPVPKSVDITDYQNWDGEALPDGEVWANVIDLLDKMYIFGELNKPLDEIDTFRVE